MGARFLKRDITSAWNDRCTINGRTFDVQICCEEGKRALSIQGGRITFFLMSEDDVNEPIAISYYDNGKWQIKCPEEDDEACIAQNYFITKWNRFVSNNGVLDKIINGKKGNKDNV